MCFVEFHTIGRKIYGSSWVLLLQLCSISPFSVGFLCFANDDVHWEGMCFFLSVREVQLFSATRNSPCCLEFLHKRTTTTHGDEEEEWWSSREIKQPQLCSTTKILQFYWSSFHNRMDGRNRTRHQHKKPPQPFLSTGIGCIETLVRVPLGSFTVVGQETSKNSEEECEISPYPIQENTTPTLAELQTQSSLGAS